MGQAVGGRPLRAAIRGHVRAAATAMAKATSGGRWLLAGALVGALPLLLALPFGSWLHQPVSAFVLFALLMGPARDDRTGAGVGLLAVAFFAHCSLAIALTAAAPEQASGLFPGGEDYWARQQVWITTGVDPEYAWMAWIPAHFQLLAACVGLGLVSMGMLPLLEGFVEVDLMNFYVGNLVAASEPDLPALLLGWHPWSVLRGICFLFVTFEVASLSQGWLAGRRLSTTRRRLGRWAAAGVFFAADCCVKLLALEPVRARLEAGLR